MIPRLIKKEIEESLKILPAVAIIGPRQVGKTTLAMLIAKDQDALYLDLEDRDDREKLSNPNNFFQNIKQKLVILDEIHRMPAIFETLRGVIDRYRFEGHGNGRFLILGSATIDLLKQSGESLAGRIAYIDMGPISPAELEDDAKIRDSLWLRGGFPNSYLADSDLASYKIRKDFIRTYLERDIPTFGPRIPSTTLDRLWTMLAHNHGSIVNTSSLAKALEISSQSVTRYIDLLSDLLLVRRLMPYSANIGKRLVKSPKIYIRDSGILHALLGISDFNTLAGHPIIGMSWEGFVIESLLSILPWRSAASFYRTGAGNEIDLVLEHVDGKKWVIEIKRSAAAKLQPGFYQAYEDIKPDRAFVVYSGTISYPITENIQAVSVNQMIKILRESYQI